MADTIKNEAAALRGLPGLKPCEVRSLSPEDKTRWQEECHREEDEFRLLMEFVDGIYPDCRKHFKADRAFLLGDPDRGGGTALYDAFDKLLSLIETFAADPGLLARCRAWLPSHRAVAVSVTDRHKAERRATKAAAKLAALEKESLARNQD